MPGTGVPGTSKSTDRWGRSKSVASPNRGELIQAWLRYNGERGEEADTTDPDWWAVLEVMNLVLREPDEAWNLVTDIVQASYTEWQLVMVGCGVLEDLLRLNPDRYMTALEEAAQTNRELVTAAACTWLDGETVRPRIDAFLREYGPTRM